MARNGRPRQFDKDQALEAAMQLFWAKGYESTGKRDLMRVTGVASQSLYNTFGDKRSFFLETIRHYGRTRVAQLVSLLSAPGSPLENVRRVIQFLSNPPEEFQKGCLLTNTVAEFGHEDAEVKALVMEHVTRFEEALTAALTRARAVGELSPTRDPRSLAAGLMCVFLGMSLMRRAREMDRLAAAKSTALSLLDPEQPKGAAA